MQAINTPSKSILKGSTKKTWIPQGPQTHFTDCFFRDTSLEEVRYSGQGWRRIVFYACNAKETQSTKIATLLYRWCPITSNLEVYEYAWDTDWFCDPYKKKVHVMLGLSLFLALLYYYRRELKNVWLPKDTKIIDISKQFKLMDDLTFGSSMTQVSPTIGPYEMKEANCYRFNRNKVETYYHDLETLFMVISALSQ